MIKDDYLFESAISEKTHPQEEKEVVYYNRNKEKNILTNPQVKYRKYRIKLLIS